MEDLKRYTIIYTDSWLAGSHMQTLVEMERVEVGYAETLQWKLQSLGIDECAVVFVFEGWPNVKGEDCGQA